MSNQSLRQQSVRSSTSTALTHNGDWHALFDGASIPAGPFNGRMIAYLNAQTGNTTPGLVAAQAAYAASQGRGSWNDVTELTP
jgi:hypothetical protein